MPRAKQAQATELSPQQVEALGLLLSGKTITETAAAIDVSRETVSRWRHNDPAFQAVYNEGLRSAWEAGRARQEEARGKAITRSWSLWRETIRPWLLRRLWLLCGWICRSRQGA